MAGGVYTAVDDRYSGSLRGPTWLQGKASVVCEGVLQPDCPVPDGGPDCAGQTINIGADLGAMANAEREIFILPGLPLATGEQMVAQNAVYRFLIGGEMYQVPTLK